MSKMKLCKACNISVPKHTKFCPNCGSNLEINLLKKIGICFGCIFAFIVLITSFNSNPYALILHNELLEYTSRKVTSGPNKLMKQQADTINNLKSASKSNTILTVTEVTKNLKAVVLVEAKDSNNKVFATGSGSIISADGKIITNYHVITGAYNCDIKLQDGTKYEVSGVLGYSKAKDIAILQLTNASNLSTVELGDSNTLQLGDSIVAIGNPLGIQNTVSTGIASGLDRVNKREGKDIQITAQINRGSSGGALFNMYGQVIGITYSGIFVTAGDFNFAIPINEVKPLLNITESTTLAILSKLNKLQSPTGLKATAESSSVIHLQWNPVDGANYYYVYVSNDLGATYGYYTNSDSDKTKKQYKWQPNYSVNVGHLKGLTTIFYKVIAVKDGIESDFSDVSSATTFN